MSDKQDNGLLAETWSFLVARKAWWLAPVIILTILLGGLFIASQSAAVSPFIYVLF